MNIILAAFFVGLSVGHLFKAHWFRTFLYAALCALAVSASLAVPNAGKALAAGAVLVILVELWTMFSDD